MTSNDRPGIDELYGVASSQGGHFTVAQARELGISSGLTAYHTRSGTFRRAAPGVYRFKRYPSWDREEVMVAWLWAGRELAVISHESALDLLDLGEEIPDAVHLIVPRSARGRQGELEGVRIHTTTAPLVREEVVEVRGMRITSAERSIADYAISGGRPDQVAKMLTGARERGLIGTATLRANGRRAAILRGLGL